MPGENVDVKGGGQDTAITGQGAAGWFEARQGRRGIYSSKGPNIFPHQITRYKYSAMFSNGPPFGYSKGMIIFSTTPPPNPHPCGGKFEEYIFGKGRVVLVCCGHSILSEGPNKCSSMSSLKIVGCVDRQLALVQYSSSFYLADTTRLSAFISRQIIGREQQNVDLDMNKNG